MARTAPFDLDVTYDDGRTDRVTAGQREFAAWEREDFGCGSTTALVEKPALFIRFLAWSALTREGRSGEDGHAAPAFSVWERGVLSVDSAETPEPPDPTRPGG